MVSIGGIELFRFERMTGQDVVVGLSWEVLIIFLWVAFFVFLVHFVVREILNPTGHTERGDEEPKEAVESSLRDQGIEEVTRFTAAQRASHWIMAISIFLLMLSGFLMMNANVVVRPIIGLSWLDIHIVFSIVLIGYVLFHLGHVASKGTWMLMWFGREDAKDIWVRLNNFVGRTEEFPRQFVYPSVQKLLHHSVAVVTIGLLVTGLVLLRRVEVPLLWDATREFTFLGFTFGVGDSGISWGLVTWSFVLHDFLAIGMVALVVGHVYFAIRPNEWPITKSMITGSLPVEAYAEKYSPRSWSVEGERAADGGEPDEDR